MMSSYSFNSSTGTDVLELSLREILAVIRPSEEDVSARHQIINELKALVQSIASLRGATVEPFGSFVSNLYTRWGDLDISIQLHPLLSYSSIRYNRVSTLSDIKATLHRRAGRGGISILKFLPNARVPLLVVEMISSNHKNIHCDISVNNWPGKIKSKFLLWITQIDERFRDMVLLVKEWAKSQVINDPRAGTLNSYSLCLLVIFHFQTCEPAILPPLKEIYAGNLVKDFPGVKLSTADERNIHDTCAANIERFKRNNLRNVNRSSLSELLVSFFQKFSRINVMAAEQAICTYTGQWEHKRRFTWLIRSDPILIEDPFERPENAARAVTLMSQRERISDAFERTHRNLLSEGRDKSFLVSNLVMREIRSQIITRPT